MQRQAKDRVHEKSICFDIKYGPVDSKGKMYIQGDFVSYLLSNKAQALCQTDSHTLVAAFSSFQTCGVGLQTLFE